MEISSTLYEVTVGLSLIAIVTVIYIGYIIYDYVTIGKRIKKMEQTLRSAGFHA